MFPPHLDHCKNFPFGFRLLDWLPFVPAVLPQFWLSTILSVWDRSVLSDFQILDDLSSNGAIPATATDFPRKARCRLHVPDSTVTRELTRKSHSVDFHQIGFGSCRTEIRVDFLGDVRG